MIEKAKARKTKSSRRVKRRSPMEKSGIISRRSRSFVVRGCWNSNNGANGGAFYVNANTNNSLTNTNTNIGARLAEQIETEIGLVTAR